MIARRWRQGGNVLMIVFALIFALVTIVAVMNHQQLIARQTTMRAEAELQFKEARRFAEAQRLGKTTATLPSDVQLAASPKDDNPSGSVQVTPSWAKTLWTGLPDVMIAPDSKLAAPGATNLVISPSSPNVSLLVFGKNKYRLVDAPWFGYAAYAPKGALKAEQVFGWSNPSFEDGRKSLEAYNGLPAILACNEDMQVEELKYGMAYVKSGDIDLGTKSVSVPFKGYFPFPPLENDLASQIQSAFTAMQTPASTVDKTKFIKGGIFDGIASFALFFGGGSLQVTLEQAMTFPFPPIPGFSQDIAGVLYEFYISLPEPPDISKVDPTGSGAADKEAQDLAQDAIDAANEYKDAKKQVEDLQKQLAAATKQSDKDAIQKDLDKAKTRLKNAEDDLNDKKDDLLNQSALHKDEIEHSFITPVTPKTRLDDKAFAKMKRGQIGWPYRALLSNMLTFLMNIITGDLDGIKNAFFKPVRIIHYGRKTNVPDFEFGSGLGGGFLAGSGTFSGTSTWTVPAGRTFAYTGNMEIKGDLWLQRGSAFVINGDLTLEDPGRSKINPLLPCGRIFLEEGSTLMVSGDLSCQGSQMFGSVVVGSRPGQVHPLTASILCQGDVNLPYGVFSGAPLQDVISWLDTKAPGIGSLNKVLVPFLTKVAPNVAKLRGPFYTRACYFASYAATFKIVIVPVLEVPVPLPIPLPRKNPLVSIFKALTMLYAPQLNMTLGENLYTQCDWWVFGDGVVPIFPKLDPVRAAKAFTGLSLPTIPSIDFKDLISKHYESFLRDAASKIMTKVITAITAKVLATALIPFGGEVVDVFMIPIEDAIDQSMDELFQSDNLIDNFKEDALAYVETTVKDAINTVMADGTLREVSGAFIYAGDTIFIGYDKGSKMNAVPLMASGLFVAKSDVRINAEYTIGSVVSLEGAIQLKNLLYNPYFSKVSLYVPKIESTDWVQRAFNVSYGEDFDSGLSVEVSNALPKAFTARGWNR